MFAVNSRSKWLFPDFHVHSISAAQGHRFKRLVTSSSWPAAFCLEIDAQSDVFLAHHGIVLYCLMRGTSEACLVSLFEAARARHRTLFHPRGRRRFW